VPPPARRHFGFHAYYAWVGLGRFDEAAEATGWVPAEERQALEARRLVVAGRLQEARAYLRAHFATPERARLAPSALMDAGMADAVRGTYLRLPPGDASPRVGLDAYVQGQVAFADRRYHDAVALLERAGALRPDIGSPPWLRGMRLLALAHEALGDRPQALDLLRRARAARAAAAISLGMDEWLLATEALARLLRAAGEDAEARACEDDLRARLVVADAAHPILGRLARSGAVRPTAPRATPTPGRRGWSGARVRSSCPARGRGGRSPRPRAAAARE
jgi:tetratricopeptide (TPR) repeat protein